MKKSFFIPVISFLIGIIIATIEFGSMSGEIQLWLGETIVFSLGGFAVPLFTILNAFTVLVLYVVILALIKIFFPPPLSEEEIGKTFLEAIFVFPILLSSELVKAGIGLFKTSILVTFLLTGILVSTIFVNSLSLKLFSIIGLPCFFYILTFIPLPRFNVKKRKKAMPA